MVVLVLGLVALSAPLAGGAALLASVGSGEAIAVTPAAPGAILVRPMGGGEWWRLTCLHEENPGENCGWYCDDPPPRIAVVVDPDALHISISRILIEPVRIARDGREWELLGQALRRLRRDEVFHERTDLRVAAGGRTASGVTYEDLIRALDVAGTEGFPNVELFPVEWLYPSGPVVRATEAFDPRNPHWP